MNFDLFVVKLENDCHDKDIDITDKEYEEILKIVSKIKTCVKCNETKPLKDMCKTGNRCIKCYNEYLKEYMRKKYKKSQKVKCDVTQPRVCKFCNINKNPNEFYSTSKFKCIECIKKRYRDHYSKIRKEKYDESKNNNASKDI